MEQPQEQEQPQEKKETAASYKAYCLSCKGHQEVKEYQERKTKNNHSTIAGKCGTCNRNVSTFISKKGMVSGESV